MFIFKGISSVDMKVFAKEENFLGHAPINYETIFVEGKDGQEIIQHNHLNFQSTLEDVVLMGNYDESLAWLSGKGELEYLGKITTVQFLDGYIIAKENQPFSIPFVREPFWFKKDDQYEYVSTNIVNTGNVAAKPLIKLTGTGEVELRIAGVQFEYDFKNDDYVIIDCEDKNAYFEGLYRNKQLTIGYEFPILQVGENAVEIINGSCIVEVKRKDVWL